MTIRVGSASAFYGDGLGPVEDVLRHGVDYLVCETLSEMTMAILQIERQQDESMGYCLDLPEYVTMASKYLGAGKTRLITNAGGINPIAAGRAALKTLRAEGVEDVKVATIVGDDVCQRGQEFGLSEDALFASIYIGAEPIVQALQEGAQVVIAGRVADASLFLAPLIYEFGWDLDDWDRLAGGIVVGHLLECTFQATGGNYSGRWWENPNWDRPAFPIAECEEDGTAVVTKPDGTGGSVTFDTLREQLLYEVHDPSQYLNPDVTVDMTSVTLTDLGADRVRISDTRGTPRPQTYKGLMGVRGDWIDECRVSCPWPDAEAKVRSTLQQVRRRAEQLEIPVDEWCEEFFGLNGFGGDTLAPTNPADQALSEQPPEVMARLAWRCKTAEDAARVTEDINFFGLWGPPGISGMGRAGGQPPASAGIGRYGGRPPATPSQLISVESFFVDRDLIDRDIHMQMETS